MAIVINTVPFSNASVNGTLPFVVYEATKATDPGTYPNYKYICDVYVTGSLVARLKAYPDPLHKRGVFDIAPIVRNYITPVFNPVNGSLRVQELPAGQFHLSVQCKFGEEIDGTLTTNLLVDTAKTYYNHYNGRLLYGSGSILAFAHDRPITRRPQISKAYFGEPLFFTHYPTTTTNIPYSITSFTANGTMEYNISGSITPSNSDDLQVFDFSPDNINIVSAGTITPNTSFYEVEINSYIYRIYIGCEAKYELNTLHFLNQFGGFDSFTFTKISRKTEDIERKSFGSKPNRLISTGLLDDFYGSNIYHEQKTNYATRFSEKITLNTDILTDEEFAWLAELIKSPMVYLGEPGFYLGFHPVTISASNYDYKKRVNDRLNNLKIDLEFGADLNTQYR